MSTALPAPGARLYGFCNGYFGRDSYGDKIVIASGEWCGNIWIIAVDDHNELRAALDVPRGIIAEWTGEDE